MYIICCNCFIQKEILYNTAVIYTFFFYKTVTTNNVLRDVGPVRSETVRS